MFGGLNSNLFRCHRRCPTLLRMKPAVDKGEKQQAQRSQHYSQYYTAVAVKKRSAGFKAFSVLVSFPLKGLYDAMIIPSFF